jgi:hypothetical protein
MMFAIFLFFAATNSYDVAAAAKSNKPKTIAEMNADLAAEKKPEQRFDILERIVGKYASEKIDSKNQIEARTAAESLLKNSSQFKSSYAYGNAIHHGNLVLGRIQLINGDLAGARQFLLKAGQTPGSPQLDSFGPNMTLAKELLEAKESKSVLEYLDACAKFWKTDAAKVTIQTWKNEILSGSIPNFRGNLLY